jgi:hypothetical protein
MAHTYADLVKQYTETTGTGTYTLTSAVANFRTFGVALSNGDTTTYKVEGFDSAGSYAYEIAVGTYTASGTTMARTTIITSSTGSAINWGPGAKVMTLVSPAERMVMLDAAGTSVLLGAGAAPTNGQLLIGNGTGFVKATISGTANRVTVTNGSGTVTLSGPQDLHTGASPTFAGLWVGSRTSALNGEVVLLSPQNTSSDATMRIGLTNNSADQGSPQGVYLGIDGPAFGGVAHIDTSSAGVSSPVPFEIRMGGVVQARWNYTASANRYPVFSASNGGNPTVSTSGGRLFLRSSNENVSVLVGAAATGQFPIGLVVQRTGHATSRRAAVFIGCTAAETGGWGLLQDVDGNGTLDFGIYDANTGTVPLKINALQHIVLPLLPTSSAGLSSGTLWNDGGTLKIA